METELCKLAYKYRTDKCRKIKHPYTPVYYKLFKDIRNKVKKVFEVGIGYKEIMGHCEGYTRGASLYMWRDFFPNAMVYGMDININSLVQEDRIKSFHGDQSVAEDLDRILAETGTDIDIFIDDGSHQTEHQIFTCNYVFPKLWDKAVYIIEDANEARCIVNCFRKCRCEIVDFGESKRYHDDSMVILRK